VIPLASGGHAFSSINSIFSSRETSVFSLGRRWKMISLEISKSSSKDILVRDDQHGWRRCTER
jgi:hypothetical protein